MADKYRLFIAIELEQVLKGKLEKIQNILRDCSLKVKWVDKNNFHITLKFLGEVSQGELSDINEKILEVTEKVSSFKVQIKGLGAFPNLDYPKVIWTGIEEGQEELISLHKYLEEVMINLGFKAENNKYRPHITLGRTSRKEKNFSLISKRLKEFPFKIDFYQEVKKISLIKSRLTSKGPIYTSLAEFKL
ncbi:RNA 2',3'-cyclic phosphodiesterase [Orenia marismortui]|uniref:RNA 2',3'-cyclic phosphodiesterase n=1 Tax=Orenia marismortui TaxID=46469 RepID=A0A4R8H0S6_9FIRM|nr:RNA 2',3'-cyclic phosphodiesterase [Orenia marismortui]TDX52914.1 2'-5' RNA ligase [Orenia marismortui]